MNSRNSKACDPHRLLLNLSNKIGLKGNDKYVTLSNLSICYTWKNIIEILVSYICKNNFEILVIIGKNISKNLSGTARNLLIGLNNLLQMHLKLLKKGESKKQQKLLVI